jgi:hypothetical protein
MFEITTDTSNKDLLNGQSIKEARQYYLDLAGAGGNAKSLLGEPTFETILDRKVLRCDLVGSLKGLASEKYIASIKEDVLVYCAPRAGYAAIAIANLAKLYKKRAVFFSPACAAPTSHQAATIALGAELRFVKIAAMPVLNKYAKDWAEKHGAKFLPFGLAGVPEVTAGIVNLADKLMEKHGEPDEFWCATSTGTMIRGFEIGWPNATPCSIAVSRNIHPGEIGRALVTSAELPFLKASPVQPPFPTTAAYDAKAWEPCLTHGHKDAVFINVGSDKMIEETARNVDYTKIDSQRAWHDFRDLERGL